MRHAGARPTGPSSSRLAINGARARWSTLCRRTENRSLVASVPARRKPGCRRRRRPVTRFAERRGVPRRGRRARRHEPARHRARPAGRRPGARHAITATSRAALGASRAGRRRRRRSNAAARPRRCVDATSRQPIRERTSGPAPANAAAKAVPRAEPDEAPRVVVSVGAVAFAVLRGVRDRPRSSPPPPPAAPRSTKSDRPRMPRRRDRRRRRERSFAHGVRAARICASSPPAPTSTRASPADTAAVACRSRAKRRQRARRRRLAASRAARFRRAPPCAGERGATRDADDVPRGRSTLLARRRRAAAPGVVARPAFAWCGAVPPRVRSGAAAPIERSTGSERPVRRRLARVHRRRDGSVVLVAQRRASSAARGGETAIRRLPRARRAAPPPPAGA